MVVGMIEPGQLLSPAIRLDEEKANLRFPTSPAAASLHLYTDEFHYRRESFS